MNEVLIYKHLIDPILSGLHARVLEFIPAGSTIIDVACGTGTLSLKMSEKALAVTGIDLSETMINTATAYREKKRCTNVAFRIQDAMNLEVFKEAAFDLAVLSLAIHQFTIDQAEQVTAQAQRIARQIIFVDYSHPLPNHVYTPFVYLAERLAGSAHYKNFRQFQRLGGINRLIRMNSLEIIDQCVAGSGIFTLLKCK